MISADTFDDARATFTSTRVAQSMGSYCLIFDFPSVQKLDDFQLFDNMESRNRGYEMPTHIGSYGSLYCTNYSL